MCASLWITRHPLCFYEGSQSAKRHNHFHYLRTKPPPTYTYPILTGSSHHSLVRRPRESEWDVTGSLTERNRGLACQTVFPAPSSPPTHIHCAVLKNGICFPSHRNQLKAVFAVAVASSTSAAGCYIMSYRSDFRRWWCATKYHFTKSWNKSVIGEEEQCATVIIKHLLFQFDTLVQLFIGVWSPPIAASLPHYNHFPFLAPTLPE